MMAKKVVVQLVDDVDGTEAEETVSFALDGVSYEVDVNSENAARIREVLQPWISVARRAGGRRTTGRAAASASAASDASKIRDWARRQGIEVSERGRIPANVREQYLRSS